MNSKLLKKRNPKNKSKKHKSSNLSNKMIKKIGIKQSKKSSLKRKRKYKSHKRLNVKTGGVLPEDGLPLNTSSQRHTNPLPPPIPLKTSQRHTNPLPPPIPLKTSQRHANALPPVVHSESSYSVPTSSPINDIYNQPNPPLNQNKYDYFQADYSLVNEPPQITNEEPYNQPNPPQITNEALYNQPNPPVNNIYNTINEPPTNEKPLLVVTLGATGSGKSSLLDQFIKERNLNLTTSDFKHILIDDLVEINPYYKKKIKDIIKRICKTNNPKILCDTLQKQINDNDSTLLKLFSDAYFTARKSVDCNTGKILTSEKKTKLNCDSKNDNNLYKAIQNGENILFESTGTSYPEWLIKLAMDKTDTHTIYNITFIYSLVSLENLVIRNKIRCVESFNKFLKNDNIAPRFPDTSKLFLSKTVKLINDNLIDFINNCVYNNDEGNTKHCSKLNYLVYSNNYKDKVLLFDSMQKEKYNITPFIKKLNTELGLNSVVGGFNKTKRKRKFRKLRKQFKTYKVRKNYKLTI